MEVDFYDLGGESTDPKQLDPIVQTVYQACLNNPSCEVLDLRRDNNNKTQSIVAEFSDGTFELDNLAGINRVERLSITYCPNNDFFWEIRALRKSFPVTTHQNHVLDSEPRSLCLYIEPWLSVERSWTPELFIKRIFWWLRETANGTIHGDDQPLEQLFFSSPYNVILPENYFKDDASRQCNLSFSMIEDKDGTAKTLVGKYAKSSSNDEPFCVTVPVLLQPLENGPIEEYPHTLGQLQTLLENRGGDIVDLLRNSISSQVTEEGIGVQNPDKEFVLLLIGAPRIRNGVIEKIETQGFMIDFNFGDLGEKLGVLLKAPGQARWYRDALGKADSDNWLNIPIFPVSVSTYPTREDIRQYSGIARDDVGPNGIIAGVGALGGMIAQIWGRECWGKWVYIDDDILKPHNIARHVSTRHGVGFSKPAVTASVINNIHDFDDNVSTKYLVGSAISDSPEIVNEIESADILVDVTTTLHVPRTISRKENHPRAASVFVTPSGMASVLLLEDIERNIRCSSLEAQYYRAILNNDWGKQHLSGHMGKFWVGAGCREATVAMSNELINLHASILSRQLRISSSNPTARICVWDYQDELGNVAAYDIKVSPSHSASVSGWELCWDHGFLDEAKEIRKAALPNETGGLLFGIIDQKDKSITLVKACHAPDNSESTPTSFERGAYESTEILDEHLERTGGVVTYIGEWHSHPEGCSVLPSQDDVGQLNFLTSALQSEGMPALMLIVAESDIGIYLEGKGVVYKDLET